MDDEPRATVRRIDGQLVLDDPDALAMVRVVAEHNCRVLLDANRDRVIHFVDRAAFLGRVDTVVVAIHVDEPSGLGRLLAEATMPGQDWQQFRNKGMMPVARGLVVRDDLQAFLVHHDPTAAAALARCPDHTPIVVVEDGIAAVFFRRDMQEVGDEQP